MNITYKIKAKNKGTINDLKLNYKLNYSGIVFCPRRVKINVPNKATMTHKYNEDDTQNKMQFKQHVLSMKVNQRKAIRISNTKVFQIYFHT
jgi:hypothetical protein